MRYNNHKGSKNRRGLAFSIVSTILVIVAASVVLIIVIGGLKNNFQSVINIFSKYGPPKINESTAYLYSIENFTISNADEAGCKEDTNQPGTYTCQAGRYVDFSAQIKNGGTLMRKIYGAIIVCKAECRRGSCQPLKGCGQNFAAEGESCFIADGETLDCEAGSYQFTSGSYIVYPAAKCALQSDVGCFTSAMSDADKIYDPKKSLNIIVS